MTWYDNIQIVTSVKVIIENFFPEVRKILPKVEDQAVFDLLGGFRGFNPPLHEDDLPTVICLGGQLWPPSRIPGATGQNVEVQKLFVSQRSSLWRHLYLFICFY